jgi:hypothetical protein
MKIKEIFFQLFGDRIVLCGDIDTNFEPFKSRVSTASGKPELDMGREKSADPR